MQPFVRTLTAALIIATAAVSCTWMWIRAYPPVQVFRYQIVATGDNRAFVLDRRTGKTWHLRGAIIVASLELPDTPEATSAFLRLGE